MNHIKLFIAVACTLLASAGCGGPGTAPRSKGHVRVAAAADLNAALGALIEKFGESHDVDVTVSYGSSGTFYAQLLNRAPFDLFLSADIDYPRQLAARGLTIPDGEFTYAVGRLVVWVRASSAIDPARDGLQSLGGSAVAHVAIANPEHAPYGRAAMAALQTDGILDRVRSKLVYGENVAQALQFVQSGAAEAGIVALSLALAPNLKDPHRCYVDWASKLDALVVEIGVFLSRIRCNLNIRYNRRLSPIWKPIGGCKVGVSIAEQ